MIRLENVTKHYQNDVVALRDASFDVAKGEFVFLVGPSGSGKSTLLRLLNRQDRPEQGAVWVAGRNIIDMPSSRVPQLRRNIGNVFQDFKLLSNKTVFENIAFAQEVIGKPKHVIAQQVPAVLDLVGLAGKEARFPHQLSGGEQQRVSIARAFVNRPLIMLADEPTGNLDPATGEGIMRLLGRINQTGTTVLMATHDQRIVNIMRKRVIQLDRGVIVARPGARGVRVAMLSRLTYTFRETWASFRRNTTLTVAAVITSAVSLLIFGLTLLMQRGFDNLLVAWEGDVEMIVYLNSGATEEQRGVIQNALDSQTQLIDDFSYCDTSCSLAEAQRLLAGDPGTLELLDETNIPTQYKVVPTDATDVDALRQLREGLRELPNVQRIVLADEQLDVISELKGFVGLYTLILSVVLLFAAILLIWNTIRTAMFARRREIEVMKLVGATDWFIRIPFMLEGLIQGFIGGLAACGGLWLINNRWTAGVGEFPPDSGFAALVVTDGFEWQVMLLIVGIGMVAGAIGSGIAASRFLDV